MFNPAPEPSHRSSFLPSFLSLFALLVAYMLIFRFAFAASSFSLRLLALFSSFSASLAPSGGRLHGGGAGGEEAQGAEQQQQQQRTLLQRARGALGWDEGAVGAAAPAAVDGAAAPPAPALVDGGLSERQFQFMSIFRWSTALYIAVVRKVFAPPPHTSLLSAEN